MSRFMRRGYTQNRIRNIWKSVKYFYSVAEDYDEFTSLCSGLYYSSASADLDMEQYLRLIKAVKACM